MGTAIPALGSNGATSRLFGTAAGADYWFSAHTLAGFALAGGGTNFSVANGAIRTLRGRAAWAHDFNPDRAIAATFQTLPGASFVINGAAQARDAALTTASAEVKWRNGLAVGATFEGEFSSVTRSYSGKGVVRYVW